MRPEIDFQTMHLWHALRCDLAEEAGTLGTVDLRLEDDTVSRLQALTQLHGADMDTVIGVVLLFSLWEADRANEEFWRL